MIRRGLALLSGGLALAAALAAQTSPRQLHLTPPAVSCSVAVVPPAECFRRSDLRIHGHHLYAKAPDHRYEGLTIGAVAGGVGGLLLSWALCGQSDEVGKSCTGAVILGTLGGAALGGFAGLMIGAQFPKETTAPADSVSN
jgi:hypothetical protein